MDITPAQWMVEPLRKYAVFDGRARRSEFWWFTAASMLLYGVTALIDRSFGVGSIGAESLASVALVLPQTTVSFRRLHDLDRSGWWIVAPSALLIVLLITSGVTLASGGKPGGGVLLIVVVAQFGLIAYSVVLLVWFSRPGTVGDNRFGPDPLAGKA